VQKKETEREKEQTKVFEVYNNSDEPKVPIQKWKRTESNDLGQQKPNRTSNETGPRRGRNFILLSVLICRSRIIWCLFVKTKWIFEKYEEKDV